MGGWPVKRFSVALSALVVIAGASACSSSASGPATAAASAPAPQPSVARSGVSFSDFHSVDCNILGPGENNEPRLVFVVNLQVKPGITVTVHSLTIQWHRRYVTGPVIAAETDPVGPGRPPVSNRVAWAFAWANTSGLTISRNGATGPSPVACTVEAISGTTKASGTGS